MTRRLMCVVAHPDDESVVFGGTLARYHRQGVHTNVICLTDGEAATHRGSAGDGELALIRRRELTQACATLGVDRHESLGFPDGGLQREPFLHVVMTLSRWIRELRPQVIITFGSEGGFTAHPDHAMTSHFATAAFHMAARVDHDAESAPHRASKLYYATSSIIAGLRRAVHTAPWSARVDIGPYLETKHAAFHAHLSQAPLFPLMERAVRKQGAEEVYYLAAAISPQPMHHETDLFEGVEDSAG